MDTATTSRSRVAFARVCIELFAQSELPDSVLYREEGIWKDIPTASDLDPKPATTSVAVQPPTSTDMQVTEEHIVTAIQPVTQPLEETKQNFSNLKEHNKFSILDSDIERPFEEENDDDVPPQDLTTTALIENPMEIMETHSKEHVADLNINDLEKVDNA
ncbi:hypothetical protein QJS10_CPA07g00692 [Acorus calamus]|uniref:Uncharacterized protein n=1 Tax=Acorus calamus TaxID=4465 RepID=A0AAV9EE35_ACOCL|nr:hypothetical protein QJS10_CPA07g00692 [Acorus calamus]